jgi:hypothetical protein
MNIINAKHNANLKSKLHYINALEHYSKVYYKNIQICLIII